MHRCCRDSWSQNAYAHSASIRFVAKYDCLARFRPHRYPAYMRAVIHFFRLVAAAALALLCNLPAQGANTVAANEAVRKAFQDAYTHAATNMEDSTAHDSESLKNYPLYPYLQAARIQEASTSADARCWNKRTSRPVISSPLWTAAGHTQPAARVARQSCRRSSGTVPGRLSRGRSQRGVPLSKLHRPDRAAENRRPDSGGFRTMAHPPRPARSAIARSPG